jgi:hypothetical protein
MAISPMFWVDGDCIIWMTSNFNPSKKNLVGQQSRPFKRCHVSIPIGSMYAIYGNIGGILMVNVTIYIYSIHGSYGIVFYSKIYRACIWKNFRPTAHLWSGAGFGIHGRHLGSGAGCPYRFCPVTI